MLMLGCGVMGTSLLPSASSTLARGEVGLDGGGGWGFRGQKKVCAPEIILRKISSPFDKFRFSRDVGGLVGGAGQGPKRPPPPPWALSNRLMGTACDAFCLSSVNLIADALRGNRTLRALDLRNNKVVQDGTYALAQMLKLNNHLETLDLRWNKVRSALQCRKCETGVAKPAAGHGAPCLTSSPLQRVVGQTRNAAPCDACSWDSVQCKRAAESSLAFVALCWPKRKDWLLVARSSSLLPPSTCDRWVVHCYYHGLQWGRTINWSFEVV